MRANRTKDKIGLIYTTEIIRKMKEPTSQR